MTNRWLFAGGDVSTFRPAGIGIYAAGGPNTLTNWYNPTYSDHRVTASAGGIAYADFTNAAAAPDTVVSGETLWVRTGIANFAAGNNSTLMTINDSSNTPWVALRHTTGGFLSINYWNGTGWTQIGSTFYVAANGNCNYIDIQLTIGSPHNITVFGDNVQATSGTFTANTYTTASCIQFPFVFDSFPSISEVMATVGIITINGHVFTGRPNGAGSNSGWTGAYTDIDDASINDSDMLSTTTDGVRSTFNYSNLPNLGTNYTIGDVFMRTRVRTDGISPTTIRPVIRQSGTDTVGSPLPNVGLGFSENLTRYTGLTATDYNNGEFGVDSSS